jgi:type IV secretory pathway ATPase VirB11/archaellum biosynthesis ATPase
MSLLAIWKKREDNTPVYVPALLQAFHDLGTANFALSVKVDYYYLDSVVGFDDNLKMIIVADMMPKFPPKLWLRLDTILADVREEAIKRGIRPYSQDYVDLMARHMVKALPRPEKEYVDKYASAVHRLLYAYGALTPLISDQAHLEIGVTDVLAHITNPLTEEDVVEVESWVLKGRFPTNIKLSERDRDYLRNSLSRRGISASRFTGWVSQVDQRFRVRATVAVPPVSQPRTAMAFRIVSRSAWTPPRYVALRSARPEQLAFLWHTWVYGFNDKPAFIIVIGQPGTGKTTLVDVVTATTPPDQPLAVVESVSEINAPQARVRLAERFALSTDIPEIRMAQLIKVALRMSVPYITTNEVLGPEDAQALFLAATIGARTMTTIHAASPDDLIGRFKSMGVPTDAIEFLRDRMIVVLMDKAPGHRFIREIYLPQDGTWAPLAEADYIIKPEVAMKAKILHVLARNPAYHHADEWLTFLKQYYENPQTALSYAVASE